jgi:DNA mismatch repair protein MutS2
VARPADIFARTLEAIDWAFVAEALSSHAGTPAGRREAARIPLETDLAPILESFDAIDEVRTLEERRAGPPPVSGIEEIDDTLVRAARGEVLGLEEIGAVRATLVTLVRLQDYLARHAAAAPTLARLGAPIDLDRKLCRAYDSALDEHGALSETTYPQLGELRRRIGSLERSMRDTLERLLESPEYADHLQDRYVTVRGDRFVLPIKAQAKSMGLGIVHDSSRSERTVFVEPAAVVPLGNQRRMAEAELRDEERRILAELSSRLGHAAASVTAALDAALALDLVAARASFAARMSAVRPETGREGVVDLRLARHPVLALSDTEVVANDLRLDHATPVLVLTGPNAGGKTVAMKTIGLCALLVRAGCFIPAEAGSRVDVFDRIFADVGDMQTVHEGLSSFSAHLVALREMLGLAGRGTLLLLDEIAAGTDPAQGGALARAVIERFVELGARVVATTHYSQVKAMGADDRRVEVAALEYREGRPTYRVVAGSVGESHALAAAVRVGIDEALVERARSLMEEGERALHDVLASLDEEKSRAAETQRRYEDSLADLARREESVSQRESEIQGRAREIERRAAAAVVERLRAAEEEVRTALTALREGASRERAEAVRAAIGQARTTAIEVQQEPVAAGRAPKEGDRVRVVRVGIAGEVVAVRGDELEIRSGVMSLRARASEVEILGKAETARSARGGAPRERTGRRGSAPQGHAAKRDVSDWLDTAMRTTRNTLDLRGARVEEGMERLDAFLDESMLEGRDIVFVLHGHGTGAMKDAIRRALASSPYVAESAPAPDDQGGDALTVSRLRD